MQKIIVDIEANGLDDANRIHCLSYCVVDEYIIKTIYTYDEIREFFKRPALFILHYGANYDLPLLHRLLGIDFTNIPFYDTIYLSNYVYPGRLKYGLEDFGEDFGVTKVKVDKNSWDGDMDNDPEFKKLMTDRCEGDIKITANLWVSIIKRLEILYEGDQEAIDKLLAYMSFKSRRALEQQLNPLLIDTKAAEDLLIKLYSIKEEKEAALVKVMPKIPQYTIKSKPKIMETKDGKVSALGQKWLDFLQENGLPADNTKDVRIVKGWDEPNPQSHTQIKAWLYSLGWQVCTYKYVRDKATNETRKVEQVLDENKELTPSVRLLLEKEPALIEIEGLSVVNHRIAFVSGILEESYKNGGWVPQTLHALASTHRWVHRRVVNIPSNIKFMGKEIRSIFIPPPNHVIMSVDIKNLESKTMHNSIYELDEPYVRDMMDENFDAHLDIAQRSGLLTEQQVQDHKAGIQSYNKERKAAKQVNFAAIYGVGKKTLSINTGFSESKCEQLLSSFWDRNWAIKTFSDGLETKSCLGSNWVKSKSGSGFWLELRSTKDTFSAHNQNMGVFFFDSWQAYLYYYGIKVRLESHDEILLYVREDEVEKVKILLKKCCDMTNTKLKLPVYVDLDIQVGINYSQTH